MRVLLLVLGAGGALLMFQGLTARPPAGPTRSRAAGLLAGAGWRMGVGRFLLLSVTTGLCGSIAALALTGSVVVGLAGVAAAWIPVTLARRARARRRDAARAAWPDALDLMISFIRSGSALPEACARLAEHGPADLRPAFGAFITTYRSRGMFDDAVGRLSEVAADPIADRVVVALSLAHEVGGTDLVRVLRASSDMLRRDAAVRREVRARWSWTVTAARVAAAAPWVVLVMMLTRPEAARAFAGSAGSLLLGAGAVATVAGYRAMLRIARLPEEARLS